MTIVVTDREIIEKLRKLRNKIRHFAISIDRNAAISLIVKTFSFAIAFASRHLSDWSVRSDLEKLRKLLGGLCVQPRLARSVGVSPTGARARRPVAWMAGRRETDCPEAHRHGRPRDGRRVTGP